MNVSMIYEACMEENCHDNGAISDQLKQDRQRMLAMLEQFYPMWDRHLRSIKIAKHRFEMNTPDVRPIHSGPYRAGPTSQAFDKKALEKMKKSGFIEPA